MKTNNSKQEFSKPSNGFANIYHFSPVVRLRTSIYRSKLTLPNMFSSFFGGSSSATTDAPVYEEIPTPTTKEQYHAAVEAVKTKMLAATHTTEGWTPVEFDALHDDIKVFVKLAQGETLEMQKATGILNVDAKVRTTRSSPEFTRHPNPTPDRTLARTQ